MMKPCRRLNVTLGQLSKKWQNRGWGNDSAVRELSMKEREPELGPENPHKCQVGVVAACNSSLGGQRQGILRASWLARHAILTGSESD